MHGVKGENNQNWNDVDYVPETLQVSDTITPYLHHFKSKEVERKDYENFLNDHIFDPVMALTINFAVEQEGCKAHHGNQKEYKRYEQVFNDRLSDNWPLEINDTLGNIHVKQLEFLCA